MQRVTVPFVLFFLMKKKDIKKMYCDRKHLKYPRKNNV